MKRATVHIGCAGWALRKENAETFPPPGTHLGRYAKRFNAVEINSSFYRPHRRSTYARWADAVPASFAFAVKVPKVITHACRLREAEAQVCAFLDEVAGLGDRLGPLLLQLPPRLALSVPEAETFFALLRSRFSGSVVCEPRHGSWFTASGDTLLRAFDIARAAADPAVVPAAAEPGAADSLVYFRLHGSPRMYYSGYGSERLDAIARKLRTAAAAGASAWCIFDNTAAGAAIPDALKLQAMLHR